MPSLVLLLMLTRRRRLLRLWTSRWALGAPLCNVLSLRLMLLPLLLCALLPTVLTLGRMLVLLPM
jgi:hypothetical protein